MNAKKLKDSILQYALQGKLVQQDPNDEPASVLIERIKAEKEALISQKKIKKEKALPKITQEEIPFEIPSSWKWMRLGDLTKKIHYGYTATAQASGSVRLLRITDIQDNKVDWSNVPYCEIDERNLDNLKLEKRDILIARTGGTIGKSFLIQKDEVTSVFASYLIRVQPTVNINEKYLKKYLESELYWNQLRRMSAGTGQPNVNAQNLKLLILPIPSLSEQQRIVDSIIEFENKINSYSDLYLELEKKKSLFPNQLENSILKYAMQGRLIEQVDTDEPAGLLVARIKVEKERLVKEKIIKKEKALPEITYEEIPFDIPENWEWVRVRDISLFGNFEAIQPDHIQDEEWVLDLEEIEKNTSRLLDRITNRDKKVKSNKYKFKQGDVLYGKLRPYLNKVLVAPSEGVCTTEIFPIRFLGGIIPEYMKYILMSPYFINYANVCSYGVKMPRMGTKHMENAIVPLPPLEEQKRIVLAIENLNVKCRDLVGI